jgi:hypothetical protein
MPLEKTEYGFSVFLGTAYGVLALEPGDIQEFYFIEDIFSFCMVGKMVFEDRFGFVEFGPLTGNERLMLAYGIKNPRRLVFDIINYDLVTMSSSTVSDKGTQLVIYFVDTTYKNLTKRKYSRSWKDEKYQNILDHILHKWCEGAGENEKILLERYDKSDTKGNFIAPYWTPMECISWINKRALPNPSSSVGTELGGYLYYNNTYWPEGGSYNTDNNFTAAWKSINNLFGNTDATFSSSEDQPYIFTGSLGDDNDNNDSGLSYVNKILDWRYRGIDFVNIKKVQGGQMLGYNFDGREFIRKTYKYTKKDDKENVDRGMIDDITGLGSKSLFPNISERDADIVLNGSKTEEELDTMYCNSWLRSYSRQQSLSVIVRGWEGRFAGMLVKEIMWRSFDDNNPAGNKNLIGPYLIKSITHNFGTRDGYTQRVVLLKNAYQKSDCDSLIDIGKSNTASSSSILGV